MANHFSRRFQLFPGTSWAWWLFFILLASTAGWFWLLGHDLHLDRRKDSPPAAKAKH